MKPQTGWLLMLIPAAEQRPEWQMSLSLGGLCLSAELPPFGGSAARWLHQQSLRWFGRPVIAVETAACLPLHCHWHDVRASTIIPGLQQTPPPNRGTMCAPP